MSCSNRADGCLTQTEGGIQIDVFPKYPTSVSFIKTGEALCLYNTPRELGLAEGDRIKMLDQRIKMLDQRLVVPLLQQAI